MWFLKSKFDRLSAKEVKLQNMIAAEEKDAKDEVDNINKTAKAEIEAVKSKSAERLKAEIEAVKSKSAERLKALKSKLDLVTRHKNAEHDHVVSEQKQSK